MPQETKLISTRDVAKRLDVSVATIARWVKSGKIVGTMVGRSLIFSADEVERCLSRIRERWS